MTEELNAALNSLVDVAWEEGSSSPQYFGRDWTEVDPSRDKVDSLIRKLVARAYNQGHSHGAADAVETKYSGKRGTLEEFLSSLGGSHD